LKTHELLEGRHWTGPPHGIDAAEDFPIIYDIVKGKLAKGEDITIVYHEYMNHSRDGTGNKGSYISKRLNIKSPLAKMTQDTATTVVLDTDAAEMQCTVSDMGEWKLTKVSDGWELDIGDIA
jgi:hypothetical protein